MRDFLFSYHGISYVPGSEAKLTTWQASLISVICFSFREIFYARLLTGYRSRAYKSVSWQYLRGRALFGHFEYQHHYPKGQWRNSGE